MDDKLKALLARTNLDELAPPPDATRDYHQPVANAPTPTAPQIRSTTDPLQIQFAAPDMIGKLQEPRVGGKLRLFALVFLAGPFMIFGVMLLGLCWLDPATGQLHPFASAAAWIRAGYGSLAALALIAGPAWLVLRRRPLTRPGHTVQPRGACR